MKRLLLLAMFLVSTLLMPAPSASAQGCQDPNGPALTMGDFGVTSTYGYPDTYDKSRDGWFVYQRDPQAMADTSYGAYLYGTTVSGGDTVKEYYETRYRQLADWGTYEEVHLSQFGEESSAYQRPTTWEIQGKSMAETYVIMRKGCRVGFFVFATMSGFNPNVQAERYARLMEIRL